ncbi:hypothetical protein MPSEU_000156300 [Mayamaea pseudoterrestris]|nr:hypothetical protein MPSEU_000156300 [Mayamaea pseudoterrestris]
MQQNKQQQENESTAATSDDGIHEQAAPSLSSMQSIAAESMPSFRSVALLSSVPPLQQHLQRSEKQAAGSTASLTLKRQSFSTTRTTAATSSTTLSSFASSSTFGSQQVLDVHTSQPLQPQQQEYYGWKQPVLTTMCCYSFLEPYHVHMPVSLLHSLLTWLPQVFAQLSLHVTEFCESPVCARMNSWELVGMCVSLLKIGSSADEANNIMVLQVQRRSGCSMVFGTYARAIIKQVEDFVAGTVADHVQVGRTRPEAVSKMDAPVSFGGLPLLNHHHHHHHQGNGLAESVLERCSGQAMQQQQQHHFHNVFDTNVLIDTAAMLQCFATRYLALEALTILTDPMKTTKSVVRQVSRVLLCGGESDAATDNNKTSFSDMVRTIIGLAITGQWNDKDAMEDDCSCDDRARFLALQALVNAMHVVDCQDAKVLSLFCQTCRHHTGCDWTQFLCEKLHAAQHEPHAAFLAAKALCRLHKKAKKHEPLPLDNHAMNTTTEAAKQAVLCPHVALQVACQQLLGYLESG